MKQLLTIKSRFSFLLKAFLITGLALSSQAFAQQAKSLDDYLSRAKSNSPLLNDFNNQVYSLKIDSLKLKADYGFQVEGYGDLTYPTSINGWGYNGSLYTEQNLAAIVRVTRDLLGKGNLSSRLANYNLEIQQTLNKSEITIQTLNRAVTEQYINTYASQQQYDIVKEIVQLLEREDNVLNELTKTAVFKQTDYLTFKVILQQNMLELKQRGSEWQNNYAILNYLSGIVDTSLPKLEPPTMYTDDFIAFDESVYAQSYHTDSLKIANEAKIIRYDYIPRLSVYADGGYSSALASAPYKNFGFSAGLSLTVPIYDGNKKKKLLLQNQIAEDTRTKYNEFARNQYLQQIVQIQGQIKQYNQMTEVANEQMKYAETLIEANLKQLPTGDVKVVDFILSINNYLNLKSGLVQFKTNLYNLHNQLHNLIIQ